MHRTKKHAKSQRKPNRAPRNRFGPRVAHSSTKTMTRIAPDELDVRLMYRRVDALSNGAGGTASKGFHTNGAYDVDPSLSSTETYGFDEYAALYTYYRVIGYSYEVTIVNQSTDPVMGYVLNTNYDPTVAGSSFYLYSTNPHCKSKLISPESPNVHTFRGKHSIAQITGTPAVETADTFRALVNAIPADLTWLTVAVEAVGGATVTTTVDFKLIMHVRFYSREVDLTLGARVERINKMIQDRDDYQYQKRAKLTREKSKEKIDRPVPSITKH